MFKFRQVTHTNELQWKKNGWWVISSEQFLTRSHQQPAAVPARDSGTHLQVSVALHLGLSSTSADNHCQVLVILVFVPSFKTFLISYLVPTLRTVMVPSCKGEGKCCVLQKQKKGGRWTCCRRPSFQIASRCAGLFHLLHCLIVGRRPAYQPAGN